MDWKSLIKPNLWKINASMILTFVWNIILYIITPKITCMCASWGFENCVDFYSFLIIKDRCHCGCISISEVFMQYLWVIVIPFLVIYILYSIVEMFIKKYKA
jgi:hypothetical protein